MMKKKIPPKEADAINKPMLICSICISEGDGVTNLAFATLVVCHKPYVYQAKAPKPPSSESRVSQVRTPAIKRSTSSQTKHTTTQAPSAPNIHGQVVKTS